MAENMYFAPCLEKLVDDLFAVSGVQAIVLGGSRAAGSHHARSDWDVGVYYREPLDCAALQAIGPFHAPGSWGRIMNGGAWMHVHGMKVDVLLRDVDILLHWSDKARQGEFEIDLLLGYLAGIPTYSLAAEHAVAKVLRGSMPPPLSFPPALARLGAERWRFHREFSLQYAHGFAQRGDRLGMLGHAARATMEEAHARMCSQSRWVLNEKHLVHPSGLGAAQALFNAVPEDAAGLATWLERLQVALNQPHAPGA